MPLDVVKTRMQTEREKYGSKGALGAGIAIARDEGAGALVQVTSARSRQHLGGITAASLRVISAASPSRQGAAPTLLGYALAGSLAFGLTDTLSRALKAGPRCARDAREMAARWPRDGREMTAR